MGKQLLAILICFSLLVSCSGGPVTTASPANPTLYENIPQASSIPSQTPTINTSLTPLSFPSSPSDLLIQTLPEKCAGIGSSSYSEPPINEASYSNNNLPSLVLEHGTIILVTNNSDEVNGDSSSVNALIQNPGTDGVSLREALQTTNNDPGEYTIRFVVDLKGKPIQVGSWNRNELPPLNGGFVILNGDVDGDGQADITLENHIDANTGNPSAFGFHIRSSGNMLYALRIVGFSNAVLFEPESHDQVYVGNTLYRLVIEGGNGLGLYSGKGSDIEPIEETRNIWRDIKIIGNTINAGGGMSLALARSSGDRIENLTIEDNLISINAEDSANVYDGIILTSGYGADSTENEIQNVLIANNTIKGNPNSGISLLSGFGGAGGNSIHHVYILRNTVTLLQRDLLSTMGIQITAGYWANQEGNTVSDILIANNTIEGYQEAIFVISAGAVGSSWNHVERIRISNNHIVATNPVKPNGAQITAISILTGDGATDYMDPSFQPVVYPDNNLIQDIWISGNVIEGQGGGAVSLGTGDPGSQHNRIKNIYILGNEMFGFYPGSGSMISVVSLYLGGINDNRISQVFIQQNTIEQSNLRNTFIGEEFVSGGILLTAGGGAEKNVIQDIWIVNNEITSPAPGINIVGGYSTPEMKTTQGNVITDVQVWCNSISEKPVMLQALFPSVKGINLAGGYGLARDNLVSNILLYGNIVSGVENDVSIFQNAGEGSDTNRVDYQLR